MMDANETLHREALELLGFEVIWSTGGGIYHLRRNGGLTIGGGVSIDKAWAQAPTLDALTLPLLKSLMGTHRAMYCVGMGGEFFSGLVWSSLTESMFGEQSGATYEQAIAALFVAACKAGLIDASKVVL